MGFAEIGGISIFIAFFAGLLSIASPCILPLIPAYLGYLTGASLEGPSTEAGTPVPAQAVAGPGAGAQVTEVTASAMASPGHGQAGSIKVARPSPFLHAVSFTSGFSLVFILFGISLGIIGFFLRDQQDIIFKVSGSTLVILGLHLAGVITIPFLEVERRLDAGSGAKVGYARSFVVGSTFSAGWSPCIGPTLGAILALAVTSGTVAQAGVLLFAYAAGLAGPFLVMGAAYGSIKPIYNYVKRYLGYVNFASGALIIVVGVLIFTDSLINLNTLFNFGLLGDVSTEV